MLIVSKVYDVRTSHWINVNFRGAFFSLVSMYNATGTHTVTLPGGLYFFVSSEGVLSVPISTFFSAWNS